MSTANELIGQILRAAAFTVTGRVGQDPDLKYFQSGSCKVSLSLAVSRPGAKRDDPNAPPPDWFKAEFWGPDAEDITNVIRKGDLLRVTGRIRSDRWTGKDGKEHTDVIIAVDEWWQIVNGRPLYRDEPAAEAAPAAPAAPVPAANGWGGGPASEEEVPF